MAFVYALVAVLFIAGLAGSVLPALPGGVLILAGAVVYAMATGFDPIGPGRLAILALMTGWWLLLPLVGIVLVVEALSDIVQIGWFQLRGRRVFKMAPLHHHFELAGWSEPQVVTRFWLVGMVGGLLAIALALTG